MSVKENIALARDAIKFVDKLGIVSINVPFRPSFHKSPFSKFDMFLFYLMRAEGNMAMLDTHTDRRVGEIDDYYAKQGYAPLTDDQKLEVRQGIAKDISTNKSLRSQCLAVMHGTDSSGEKKRKLKKIMTDSQFNADTFSMQWHATRTDMKDEERIRAARRAIKFKHGNCGEKSAVAASWLLEHTKGTKDIYWVSANNWDHAWCVLTDFGKSSKAQIGGTPISEWDDSAVCVDGWTSDWYPIKHPYTLLHHGTAANPFQLYVRRKVQKASANMYVKEKCKWPPKFCPTFSMANAHKKVSEYATSPKRPAKVVANMDLADEIDDLDALLAQFEEDTKGK